MNISGFGLLLVAFAAIQATVIQRTGHAANNTVRDVTVLRGSIEPLREYFNANKGKPRFIAILSPT